MQKEKSDKVTLSNKRIFHMEKNVSKLLYYYFYYWNYIYPKLFLSMSQKMVTVYSQLLGSWSILGSLTVEYMISRFENQSARAYNSTALKLFFIGKQTNSNCKRYSVTYKFKPLKLIGNWYYCCNNTLNLESLLNSRMWLGYNHARFWDDNSALFRS